MEDAVGWCKVGLDGYDRVGSGGVAEESSVGRGG